MKRTRVLTHLVVAITFSLLYLHHFTHWFRSSHGQAYVSPQQQAAYSEAWLPHPYGNALGT